ncbi:hypothetical protein [Novipirellula sp.]|uniref:hypothetical protein n=1 Tax=Novipirellula sp. TaxID=2795430 RepID=UPI003564B7D7
MKTATDTNIATNVAARVAGEDIKPGDYVTALTEIYELPSFLWCCSGGTLAAEEPVRSVYKAGDAGQPSKVIAVCLPFVYAKKARGDTAIFDIRKHQLVRLDRDTGRKVWKRLRKAKKK